MGRNCSCVHHKSERSNKEMRLSRSAGKCETAADNERIADFIFALVHYVFFLQIGVSHD
jgi:hypothetical protein